MKALSILDLVMVGEGQTFADALENTKTVAQRAEKSGYKRYWIAEHHNIPGIGSAATSLVIQHIAMATKTIRVGAGGIMLPNHSPLAIAEQFATLDTLFPHRIDLGLGRAPGSSGEAVRALRGESAPRDFGSDINLLVDYLSDNGKQPVRAISEDHTLPIYMLGSSMQSAHLAAKMGLPYVFASHFAPTFLLQAIQQYRAEFQPSEKLDKPHVIVGANIFAADSHDEAQYIASSHRKWMSALYSGKPQLLQPPEEGYLDRLTDMDNYTLRDALHYTAAGTKDEVSSWIRAFFDKTQADEIIIDARIYDAEARSRSFELVSEAISDLIR